jgi:hypothetical protein
MTTFKIVFTFDVFFSAETTCTADVLHSYLVFSIYLAKKKQKTLITRRNFQLNSRLAKF